MAVRVQSARKRGSLQAEMAPHMFDRAWLTPSRSQQQPPNCGSDRHNVDSFSGIWQHGFPSRSLRYTIMVDPRQVKSQHPTSKPVSMLLCALRAHRVQTTLGMG